MMSIKRWGRMAVLVFLAACTNAPIQPEPLDIPNVDGAWFADAKMIDTGEVGACGHPVLLAEAILMVTDVVEDPAVPEPMRLTLVYVGELCDGTRGRTLMYPSGMYRSEVDGLRFDWLGWDEGPEAAGWLERGESMWMTVTMNHQPLTVGFVRWVP